MGLVRHLYEQRNGNGKTNITGLVAQCHANIQALVTWLDPSRRQSVFERLDRLEQEMHESLLMKRAIMAKIESIESGLEDDRAD